MRWWLMAVLAALTASACGDNSHDNGGRRGQNILFVVMDDVGIDQMRTFGYGGDTPARTPSIDAVAAEGILFRNTWSMPACSTSRGVFYTGRYPFRTNLYAALGPNDLANSQVSPFETTVPKLLAERGYESALFGKFHVGLQGHNPAGDGMPRALGWDFYAGWLDETGDPSSIDETAGGVAPPGTWPCGFVPGAAAGGADAGACYQADGTCEALASSGTIPPGLSGPIPPGRTCRDRGGIFDPEKSCEAPAPDYLDFTTLSGHWISPLVINHEDGSIERVPPTDLRARTYRATYAVDAAIDWITTRRTDRPWRARVAFASAHTPAMQPPATDAIAGNDAASALDCDDPLAQRELTNLMIESIDTQLARLLVATGLARRGENGRLIYAPERTDTTVVILGDNGSLGSAVKLPFDPQRAKGTAYQTGVWVPLVVAGPLVANPGRSVRHMVNIADLYALFGELAGIDAHAAVPRPIDAASMLPYLRDPDQASIRTTNFTQVGPNLQANGANNGPCYIGTTCTQIPVSKSVCEDNNGVWYGVGSDVAGVPPEGLPRCCDAVAFIVASGTTPPAIAPDFSVAVRNERYKLVQNTLTAYQSPSVPCVETATTELYEIDEAVPLPRLDTAERALPLDALTTEQQENYDALLANLTATLASASTCPGDGNLDAVVDQADLDQWRAYSESYGLSTVYDFDLDGLTDAADAAVIEENLGLVCDPSS
jgi:hypothetical protein